MTKPPKRPRDVNQWAKRMVDIATGEAAADDSGQGKDPAAVALGRKGGLKSGRTTVTKLVVDAGTAAAWYQDRVFQKLTCKRVQVDEIWGIRRGQSQECQARVALAIAARREAPTRFEPLS